jgi:hypothetical protein
MFGGALDDDDVEFDEDGNPYGLMKDSDFLQKNADALKKDLDEINKPDNENSCIFPLVVFETVDDWSQELRDDVCAIVNEPLHKKGILKKVEKKIASCYRELNPLDSLKTMLTNVQYTERIRKKIDSLNGTPPNMPPEKKGMIDSIKGFFSKQPDNANATIGGFKRTKKRFPNKRRSRTNKYKRKFIKSKRRRNHNKRITRKTV